MDQPTGANLIDLQNDKPSNLRMPLTFSSCKSPVACIAEKIPATSYPKSIALNKDLSVLSADMISKTGMQKSLIDALRLDIDARRYIAIITN